MKTIHHIFFLILAAVGLFTTACNTEDLSQDKGDPAVITLSLSNAQTRAGDLFTDESLITKVRIYVFSGNFVDAMQVYTSGTEEFQNPFRIKTTTGPKTVYVVANEPADLTATLNGVTTLTQLQAVVTSETTGSLTTPFTMIGSENVTVAYVPDPGPYTEVTVKLTRLVAKISLTVVKGTTATADIILNGVRLYRASKKSALLEGQNVTGQTYWDHNYTLPTPVTLTATGTNVWYGTSPVYMYENPGSLTDTTGRATYLIIDAVYNNVPTRYRAYINDENSDATDHKYSIKRNHQYNITAEITNIGEFDGLVLHTNVMPWTYIFSEKKFRPFVLYEATNWVPTPPVATQTESAKLTFKMLHPIGGVWKATITNGLDFAFKAGTPTTGTSGIEYTIEVIATKPAGTAARTTEFYFTIEGNEVDPDRYDNAGTIVDGPIGTGSGNRYVITQLPQ
ncbi:fimbrial protein [Petrimonas sp.]|uniref:fimbrial protein n=1 Tax=Petrimonas sp. TaxID=2023866 RepID=UPI003F514691